MPGSGIACRMFSMVYFGAAAAVMGWIMLQSDWNAVTICTGILFVLYLALTVAGTFYLISPQAEPASSPDLQLSLREQVGLRLVALLLPLPFFLLTGSHLTTLLTLNSSDSSRQRAMLCRVTAEAIFGRSCAEELTHQYACKAAADAEREETKRNWAAAESLYRLQSSYQWLSARETGPLAQTGLIAAGAMAEKLGHPHEADVLYAVAESGVGCSSKNSNRSLHVIFGPHLLKLLSDVPDAKLPPHWYLTDTVKELRSKSAAQAALTCCTFDFIVNHDCSASTLVPKLSSVRQAQDTWTTRNFKADNSVQFNIRQQAGPDAVFVGLHSTFREFSTKRLKYYLDRLDPIVARENLGFYNEFERLASKVDIDPSLLPDLRTCSVGFPYCARQLASHHVWRISERDYVGLMTLLNNKPQRQLMCIDPSPVKGAVNTY